jgi:hypothetical protein
MEMQEIQLCKPAESGCYLIAIRKSFISLRRTLQAMPREAKILLWIPRLLWRRGWSQKVDVKEHLLA